VWRLFPSFPENVSILGGVNILLTALCGGLFLAYAVKVLRIPLLFALVVTAMIWTSAHLWQVASIPLSEPLYLTTLLLALWAGGKMERTPGGVWVLLFLVAGSGAFYARTMGIAVLVAGIVSLVVKKRRNASLGVAVGSVAVVLPWVVWTHMARESIPGPLRDTLGPYGGWLASQVLQQPLAFLAFLGRSAMSLLFRTLALLCPGVPGLWSLAGLALVAPLLLGMWVSFRRSPVLPLTLLASFGILLAWPFQEIRLMVPLQPFLLLFVALGIRELVLKVPLPTWTRRLAVGTGLAWALLFTGVSIVRLATGWTSEAYRIRSAALMDAVRAVQEKTPQDAVVGAPELWPGIQLFTGRTVVPSARFRPLSGGGPVEGTPQEQYEIWIATGLTHLLVEHGGQVHGAALDRIDALCAPGTVQVLDSQPGRFLVQLSWDRACQERVLRPDVRAPEGQ